MTPGTRSGKGSSGNRTFAHELFKRAQTALCTPGWNNVVSTGYGNGEGTFLRRRPIITPCLYHIYTSLRQENAEQVLPTEAVRPQVDRVLADEPLVKRLVTEHDRLGAAVLANPQRSRCRANVGATPSASGAGQDPLVLIDQRNLRIEAPVQDQRMLRIKDAGEFGHPCHRIIV